MTCASKPGTRPPCPRAPRRRPHRLEALFALSAARGLRFCLGAVDGDGGTTGPVDEHERARNDHHHDHDHDQTSLPTTTTSSTSPPTTRTSRPTTTVPASTSTSTTTTVPTTKSSTSDTWIWIVVGIAAAALLALLIGLLVASSRRRRANRAWVPTARTALDGAVAARDLLRAEPADADAATHESIRLRVGEAAAMLDRVSTSAPDQEGRTASHDTAEELRGLLFAIEAQRLLPTGRLPPTAEQLAQADLQRRTRESELEAALVRLGRRIRTGE